jgi:hypothetical protein
VEITLLEFDHPNLTDGIVYGLNKNLSFSTKYVYKFLKINILGLTTSRFGKPKPYFKF